MTASWLAAPCPPPSQAHTDRALERQSQLTKPPGSLGQLEQIAVTLAGLQRQDQPQAINVPILIFAGDHGVTAQGVSAFPAEVTVQMLANFAAGGAAISVLARELNVPLIVIDAGTLAVSPPAGVLSMKPRSGTRDFSREAAMTAQDLAHALTCGRSASQAARRAGADALILGEMGIGNTTSASAIAAALLGRPAADLIGSGTGLDAAGRAHKASVVEGALALHGLTDGKAPVEHVLETVGGLEIAALIGAIVSSAQAGVPVLIDGFIVSVAALASVRLNPGCRPYLLFAHRSAEQGHAQVLDHLGAKPILDLDMRLGEASGAAVALPLLRLACALHNGMATFDEAAVSGGAAL